MEHFYVELIESLFGKRNWVAFLAQGHFHQVSGLLAVELFGQAGQGFDYYSHQPLLAFG